MNPAGNSELTLTRLLEKARLGEKYTAQIGAGALGLGSQSPSPGLPQHSSGANNGAGTGAGTTVDPSSQRIIVGVDFGTTYSGVAWGYTGTPQDIHVIQSWPGGINLTSPKVPSKIAYERDGSPPKWGFQVKPFQNCIECFKLFLDPQQKPPDFVSLPNIQAQLRTTSPSTTPRTITDVVRDYLQMLYDHTMVTLTRALGKTFVDNTRIEWVLTCPAVWSDKSKHATLMAAERTGMARCFQIRLISEPEAAALYTLKSIQPGNLQVGDNFVVCDAGGGTVDLISYEIVRTQPSLQIKESVTGTGDLCGSAFLNRRFEAFVKERLGANLFYAMKERTKLAALKSWEEYVKRVFVDGEDQDVFPIQFPGLPDDDVLGIDCGFMSVTREEVQGIFEPIIQEVIKLVDGQIQAVQNKGKQVTSILLVGGFGSSEYLFTRLKEKYTPILGTASNPDVVLQPVDAWTAVVRGAVIRGMETIVQTRRSRHHYGVKYWEYFDEGRHDEIHKFWDTTREKWLAENQIKWYIAKGTEVSDDKSISFPFYITFESHHSRILVDELVCCDLLIPPTHITPDVTTVCKLRSDLTTVPKYLYSKGRNSKDAEYEGLHFTMEMSVLSASLRFELRVDGVRYGEVTADFA
ncbi:actin-like ATPase domain-containing protein [Terfezia boudieri ATCC MYA-4762]|uniref:Actin-like ATPase domain-containing protein n=1 Tax=Terfezia boudieri ATCC MYA-4762 TaxID=1051890 RepID=A0A3N4LCE2_9PEZI|nr:actin-like ATPase domain-containing protein [Terfezia boudieri ATCC MYA-4762]